MLTIISRISCFGEHQVNLIQLRNGSFISWCDVISFIKSEVESCAYLPYTDDSVGDKDKQDDEGFNESCESSLMFFEQG